MIIPSIKLINNGHSWQAAPAGDTTERNAPPGSPEDPGPTAASCSSPLSPLSQLPAPEEPGQSDTGGRSDHKAPLFRFIQWVMGPLPCSATSEGETSWPVGF